jgi:hypothetical protein
MNNEYKSPLQEFPYTELRLHTGEYFDNPTQLRQAGFANTQIWSVVQAVAKDGSTWYCYGPANIWTNLVGYVGTAEHHDNDTYYEERRYHKEPLPS